MAGNMVNVYAKENLTEEQAFIINKSMEEYLNSLVRAEEERQNSQGYFIDTQAGVGSTGDLNRYYNVRTAISDREADTLTSQIEDLPEQTRKTLSANSEGAVQRGSVVQSASDKELMTPAYMANGIKNTANSNSLTNVLNQDINRFAAQIANAKAVIGNVGNAFDYTV